VRDRNIHVFMPMEDVMSEHDFIDGHNLQRQNGTAHKIVGSSLGSEIQD
jgi:hypothetical protein